MSDILNEKKAAPRKSYLDKYVEVCAECLTASCWHGEFMCEKAQHAGTVIKTTRELNAMGREWKGNYSAKKLLEVCGDSAPNGYRKANQSNDTTCKDEKRLTICPKCEAPWEPDMDQFGCWVCGFEKE